MIYAFDGFELDTQLYELRHHGQPCALERQVFDVLAFLIEHHDRVVAKTELFDAVWGSRFVSEATLSSRLMAARKALGDSGQQQRYIKTVHGRGYRFIGNVVPHDEAARRPSSNATTARARLTAPEDGDGPAPQVRYARTSDGVSIAYWARGKGYPLIHSTGAPFNHVQLECSLPDYAMWFRAYAERFRHVRFDARGSGLSSRDAADLSVEAQCRDFIAVADRIGAETFAVLATQASTLAAIRLALTYPERVTHLVLVDGYTNGRQYLRLPQTEAFRTLMRTDWPLFTETLAHVLAGDWSATPGAQTAAFFRECVSQDNCIALCDAMADADVTDLLERVSQPTLVLHHAGIAYPPMENARVLASGIPNSRLVVLNGTWQEPGDDIETTMRAIESLLAVPAVRVVD